MWLQQAWYYPPSVAGRNCRSIRVQGAEREERWGSSTRACRFLMNGWTGRCRPLYDRTLHEPRYGLWFNRALWLFYGEGQCLAYSSLEPNITQPSPQVLLVEDNWQNGGRTKQRR